MRVASRSFDTARGAELHVRMRHVPNERLSSLGDLMIDFIAEPPQRFNDRFHCKAATCSMLKSRTAVLCVKNYPARKSAASASFCGCYTLGSPKCARSDTPKSFYISTVTRLCYHSTIYRGAEVSACSGSGHKSGSFDNPFLELSKGIPFRLLTITLPAAKQQAEGRGVLTL